MLYNVEGRDDEPVHSDEEVMTEDGEVLRLERRNGKQVAVRTRPGARNNPPTRTSEREAECHACAPTPSEEAKADERYVSVIVGVALCALLAYAYYHSK